MKRRELGDYLEDILEAIQEVSDFTTGMDFNDFIEDRKSINAVIRSLEVIGEAAKNLSVELREKYPEIPWKRMARMRDKLIHEYFGVDKEMVWEVIQTELPPLLSSVQRVLNELDDARS
jgi:uncharacterized protein with HEPN domain